MLSRGERATVYGIRSLSHVWCVHGKGFLRCPRAIANVFPIKTNKEPAPSAVHHYAPINRVVCAFMRVPFTHVTLND